DDAVVGERGIDLTSARNRMGGRLGQRAVELGIRAGHIQRDAANTPEGAAGKAEDRGAAAVAIDGDGAVVGKVASNIERGGSENIERAAIGQAANGVGSAGVLHNAAR